MPDDSERLVVLLEARIRDFERNMQKASGTAEQSYGRMRRDSKTASAQMEADMLRSTSRINQALAASSMKIGAYGKAFIGGLLAGGAAAAASSAANTIKRVTAEVSKLGDQAKMAGVSVRALQEFQFIGGQNRIEIDAMVDGLKELNLRADEFVATGKGSAAEAFKRMGYDADTLAKKLKDPSDLFAELIGRMRNFDKAAQIRLADEIFGGQGGEKFVQLIGLGEEGIRRMQQEAHNLGQVMDDDVIAKAQELDQIFRNVGNTVSTFLSTALVHLGDDIMDVVEAFREMENWRNSSLDERLNDIGKQRLELETQILDKRREAAEITETARDLGFGKDAATTAAEIKALTDADAALAAEEQKILDLLTRRKEETIELSEVTVDATQVATDYIKRFREETARSAEQRRLAAETERILSDAASEGASITREQAEELAGLVIARDKNEEASRRNTAQLENETEATKRHTQAVRDYEASLVFEREQMFRSPVEQTVYAEIRNLGVDINSIEGQRIADNIRINERLYEQIDLAEELRDTLKDAASSFLQDIFSGRDALESIVQLGSRFASMNFDNFVESLGGMFGGKTNARTGGVSLGGPLLGTAARPAEVNLAAKTANNVQAAGNAFLNMIGKYEGTDKGRGYNESLAYGKFTGGPQNLIGMTLNQIDALQTSMLKHTQNTFNSSALGRYQIVRSTLRGLRSELGLSGDELFSPKLQDELAIMLAKGRGANAAGLGKEWVGLQSAPSAALLAAYKEGIEGAVETGSTIGTQKGSKKGTFDAWANMREVTGGKSSAGGFGQGALGLLGAGLGGFSTGYQSASPGMGALGGLLQGFGAGQSLAALPAFAGIASAIPFIGAFVGAIGGRIGNPLSQEGKV